MIVETKIKVAFTTELGDEFDEKEDMQTQKDLIEEHILDFCEEHHLNREYVEIIKIN